MESHRHLVITLLLLSGLWACHNVSQKPQGKSAGVESSRFQKDLFSTSEDYEDVLVQNVTP